MLKPASRWYTDEQIPRMMRFNVLLNGRASVAPMMPFHNMSDEDMVAIISFLRAQPAVRNQVPENEWTVPGKIIRSTSSALQAPRSRRGAPAKVAPEEKIYEGARRIPGALRGKLCRLPHAAPTRRRSSLSGPQQFYRGFSVRADAAAGRRYADVVPHTEHHAGRRGSALMKFPDRATFVARFKVGGRQHPGTPMPWESFARMSPDDVGALYEFLRSLPPSEGATGEVTFKKTD